EELARMEERRLELGAEAAAQGQGELRAAMDGERDRIRTLAQKLTEASVLIVRKLRFALTALETLVDDEAAQRRVLESLRGSVSLFRKTHTFTKDLDELERDIATMTRLALNFDTILKDNLGPLSILIEEVTKVDSKVADSLVEIERLSAQLESQKSVLDLGSRFDDRVFASLVRANVRREALDGIIAAMSDPADDFASVGFEAELAASIELDFKALVANMGELVRRSLMDLGGGGAEARSLPASPAGLAGAPAALPAVPAEGSEPEPESEATAAQSALAGAPEPMPAPAAPAPPPEPEPASQAAGAPAAPDWISALGNEGPRKAQRSKGPYGAAISRADPTLIVFLLDRSGSMGEPYAKGLTKAQYLARTVDRSLLELAVRCHKADGMRDYFHVACIGYGDDRVGSAFPPPHDASDYARISRLGEHPLRLETGPDGAASPVWIEPLASGGTPMTAAFTEACRFVAGWCDAHPKSYPPTVINVSDGQSTDGDPSRAAGILRRLHTDDGECLVYNLHVRSGGGAEVVFPDRPDRLDQDGKLLFEMSSAFPPHLLERAAQSGFQVGPGSRFFAYGAGAEVVTRFFELGTRPTRLA
ncbi:MAG: hypothetical protein JNG85_11095, partial [Spirochaetaceae bacterium]|nr:hypothetical protein [Spirochaetaceae bacterium]